MFICLPKPALDRPECLEPIPLDGNAIPTLALQRQIALKNGQADQTD